MKLEDPQVTQMFHRQPPHMKLHRRPQHQPHQRQPHRQVLDKGAAFYVLCMVVTIFVAKHHLTCSMYAHITAGTNLPSTSITEKGCDAFQTAIQTHHRFWTIQFLRWGSVCFGIGFIACFAWLWRGADRLKRNGGFDLTTPAVSSSCHERYIRHIWNADQNSTFKMPWELSMDTPWDACKRLRTNEIDLHGPLPPMPVSAKVRNSEGAIAETLPFKQNGVKDAKHADDLLLSDRLSWERKGTYKKWDSIILRQVGAFDVARQQDTCHTMGLARGGLLESVKDLLGTKASSMLHLATGSILQYIQFCEDRGLQAFPLIEPAVYDYAKSCETKAAICARSFLLALSFTNFHCGLAGMLSIMSSDRLHDPINTLYAEKRKLTQRPPLGRLRLSDGQQVCQLKLDQQPDGFGFVEAVAAKSKTSVGPERRARHLPVTVPLLPFGDRQWLPTWLKLREKFLGEAANSKDDFIPPLTTPAANEAWSRMPLTVTSGANWLRSLLQNTLEEQGTPIGTHSLKASLLSTCAMFEMAHSQRKLMGYHAGSKEQSMLCYSRDSMAEPVQQMYEMIQPVKAQAFPPDFFSSGRFLHREPGHQVAEKEGDELSESSPKLPSEEGVFVRHKISRRIHIMADEVGLDFVCGRKMSASCEVREPKPAFCHPACQLCSKDRAT